VHLRLRYIIALAAAMPVVLVWVCVFLTALVRGSRIQDCPSCRSVQVRPSWPTKVDKLLGFTGIMPYRCETCQKRFYALKPQRQFSKSRAT
jgi:hypothetical protein